MFDLNTRAIAVAALILGIAGLAVSVVQLMTRWKEQIRKEREEFEKLVKERERSTTFEQRTEAKLRALEETAIFRASVRDVLAVTAAKNQKDGAPDSSGNRGIFPSGTVWDKVLLLSVLLVAGALAALIANY